MNRLLKTIATAALALGTTIGMAQTPYPDRPIRVVVPYPAGGITDIVARAIAQRLTETLGTAVVVDNRAGAGGTIGAEYVARSAPDGYTLFIGTSATHGTNPSTYKNLKYNPTTDFAPILLAATAPLVISINPNIPARTLPQFIDYLKANPGKVNYASTGTGGSVHLTTELFGLKTGTKMTHVAYKGSAPALSDLMGGHVQVMFDNVPSALPLAASGKVRALAVTGLTRSSLAPELPTVSESVVPGFESSSWIALYAPAKTPPAILAKLNTAANQALKDPGLLETYRKSGLDAVGGTAEALGRYQANEIAKWAAVVKTIGYVPE